MITLLLWQIILIFLRLRHKEHDFLMRLQIFFADSDIPFSTT